MKNITSMKYITSMNYKYEIYYKYEISKYLQRTNGAFKDNSNPSWFDLDKKLEAPRSLYSSPGYNNNISQ